MKKLQLSLIPALSILCFSCTAQVEYGQFTEADCPRKISEELSSFMEEYKDQHEFIIP
jgi:hypothetical protein